MYQLQSFISDAFDGRATCSLREMFDIVECTPDATVLANVNIVESFLQDWSLTCEPKLDTGDENTERRFFRTTKLAKSRSGVLEELRTRSENQTFELKSSMYHDHRRQLNDPSGQVSDLKSLDTLHSCLKTIAGFMNSDGGILYIGVGDNSEPLGIEYDFSHLGHGRRHIDGWELELRNHLRDRFKDGHAVGSHCSVRFYQIEEKTVARLEIYPRRQETYLAKGLKGVGRDFALYQRVGNSTLEVPVDQVIEFYERRRRREERKWA